MSDGILLIGGKVVLVNGKGQYTYSGVPYDACCDIAPDERPYREDTSLNGSYTLTVSDGFPRLPGSTLTLVHTPAATGGTSAPVCVPGGTGTPDQGVYIECNFGMSGPTVIAVSITGSVGHYPDALSLYDSHSVRIQNRSFVGGVWVADPTYLEIKSPMDGPHSCTPTTASLNSNVTVNTCRLYVDLRADFQSGHYSADWQVTFTLTSQGDTYHQ